MIQPPFLELAIVDLKKMEKKRKRGKGRDSISEFCVSTRESHGSPGYAKFMNTKINGSGTNFRQERTFFEYYCARCFFLPSTCHCNFGETSCISLSFLAIFSTRLSYLCQTYSCQYKIFSDFQSLSTSRNAHISFEAFPLYSYFSPRKR